VFVASCLLVFWIGICCFEFFSDFFCVRFDIFITVLYNGGIKISKFLK